MNVVHRYVITKDRPRIGVILFNGRSSETNERRIWQSIAHVSRQAVNQVVLAAVRLIGNHDNVSPIRKTRHAVSLFFGHKLLNRGEDNAATGNKQQVTQVGAPLCLSWRLSQRITATRKLPKELVVQIIAISQHNNGWILHLGVP